jgi:hypothetical protein
MYRSVWINKEKHQALQDYLKHGHVNHVVIWEGITAVACSSEKTWISLLNRWLRWQWMSQFVLCFNVAHEDLSSKLCTWWIVKFLTQKLEKLQVKAFCLLCCTCTVWTAQMKRGVFCKYAAAAVKCTVARKCHASYH